MQVSVWFEDMEMETTDDALHIIKGIIATTGQHCQDEIRQALKDAGARDVQIGMLAY